MEKVPPLTEQEDVSIGTVEGLLSFLDYIEADYKILEESNFLSERIESVHQHLQDKIAACLQSLERGEEVSDDDVEEMQNLYNEIVAAADHLSEDNQVEPFLIPSSKVPLEMPLAANDNEQSEAREVTEEYIEELQETATNLVEVSQEMLVEYEKPVQQYPDTSFNLAKNLYAELKASADRAQTMVLLLQQVAEVNLENVGLFTLQRYEKQLKETEENLEQIILAFERLFPDLETTESADFNTRQAADVQTSAASEQKAMPLARTAPRAIQNSLNAPVPRQPEGFKSLISSHMKMALREVRYQQFVADHFESADDLEISLLRQIQDIEAPSRFDSMLGVKSASAFSFLKNLKIEDIEILIRETPESKRQIIESENIVYEKFFEWMRIYDEMKRTIRVMRPDMTFGELFVRSEIEELIAVTQ